MIRTIVVKGMGKVSVAPDLTVITMSLSAVAADYKAAMDKAAEQLESVRSALCSVGFEKSDLKTTDFNVGTKYESVKDPKGNYKSVFVGFEISHSLKAEFDLDMQRLNAVLAAISSCSAHPEFQIHFSVKDKNAVSEELLRSAVQNATEKARILASSAGVALGALQNIDYSWGELRLVSPTSYMMEERCLMSAEAAPMDIEPDDIDVSDTVTLVWEIA